MSMLAGPQGYGTDDFLKSLARPPQDFSMGPKTGFSPQAPRISNPFTPQPRQTPPPQSAPRPPTQAPTGQYPITAQFGEQGEFWSQGHKGLDLAVPMRTPVGALDGGKVIAAGYHPEFGNYVRVQHTWGTSMYAHGDELYVRPGTELAPGQVVMLSGKSGKSTGPHLHLETTDESGVEIDPVQALQRIGAQYMGVGQ